MCAVKGCRGIDTGCIGEKAVLRSFEASLCFTVQGVSSVSIGAACWEQYAGTGASQRSARHIQHRQRTADTVGFHQQIPPVAK